MPIAFNDPSDYKRLEAENQEKEYAEMQRQQALLQKHRLEAERYEDQVVPARRNGSVDLDQEIKRYEEEQRQKAEQEEEYDEEKNEELVKNTHMP